MKELCEVRPMIEEDERFVVSSFLHSLRASSHLKLAPKDTYYKANTLRLEKILARSKVDCLVSADDPTQIFSFCIHRREAGVPVVSYVFTKLVMRRRGLAADLMARLYKGEHGFFTHFTKFAVGFFKPRNFFYNPYLEDQ